MATAKTQTVKTVKVKPVSQNMLAPITADDVELVLWGFPFTVERDKDGVASGLVCEMPEADAEANIEAGRVAKV